MGLIVPSDAQYYGTGYYGTGYYGGGYYGTGYYGGGYYGTGYYGGGSYGTGYPGSFYGGLGGGYPIHPGSSPYGFNGFTIPYYNPFTFQSLTPLYQTYAQNYDYSNSIANLARGFWSWSSAMPGLLGSFSLLGGLW